MFTPHAGHIPKHLLSLALLLAALAALFARGGRPTRTRAHSGRLLDAGGGCRLLCAARVPRHKLRNLLKQHLSCEARVEAFGVDQVQRRTGGSTQAQLNAGAAHVMAHQG